MREMNQKKTDFKVSVTSF